MNKPKGHEEPIYEDIYNHIQPKFYPSKVKKDVEVIKLLDKVLKKMDNNDKKLRISKVSNGFKVEYPNDNGGELPSSEVFEHDALLGYNPDRVVWMIRAILYWMGCGGSRYDELRVRVKLEHGDKWICKDKKCKICRGY